MIKLAEKIIMYDSIHETVMFGVQQPALGQVYWKTVGSFGGRFPRLISSNFRDPGRPTNIIRFP